jgi:hypothetical protein
MENIVIFVHVIENFCAVVYDLVTVASPPDYLSKYNMKIENHSKKINKF